MAITEDAVSAAKKRVDPMDELARQFKEARSMLDDLDAKPNGEAAAEESAGETPAAQPQVLQGKLL